MPRDLCSVRPMSTSSQTAARQTLTLFGGFGSMRPSSWPGGCQAGHRMRWRSLLGGHSHQHSSWPVLLVVLRLTTKDSWTFAGGERGHHAGPARAEARREAVKL